MNSWAPGRSWKSANPRVFRICAFKTGKGSEITLFKSSLCAINLAQDLLLSDHSPVDISYIEKCSHLKAHSGVGGGNIYLGNKRSPPPLIACIGRQLVASPPSGSRWGDPVLREEIPPQTIIQSLISHSYKSRVPSHSVTEAKAEYRLFPW